MEQAILLPSVRVWDPKGPWHDQTVDIRVADGVILQVGPSLASKGAKVLESPGPIFAYFFENLWVPHLGSPADNCGDALLSSCGMFPTFGNTE